MSQRCRHPRRDPLDRRRFLKAGAGLGATAFTALGATESSAQARPPAVGSVDAHAHWVPQAYADALARLGRPTTSIHIPMELDSGLEQRLRWMDEHGVKMHVLTLDGGMPWQWVSRDDGVRLARIVNDAAVEAHRKYPDRFLAGI